MSASQVIRNYESLSGIITRMREAALHGKWEELVSLEHLCSKHVADMKSSDMAVGLDEPARKRKIELINNILADDAVIRERTEAWMGQLQRIMQNSRQEKRLQQTYGS